MSHFVYTNEDLMRKMWQSLDFSAAGESLKNGFVESVGELMEGISSIPEKAESIIMQPVRAQARRFLVVHGEYLRSSAVQHRIPYELLAGIIFTEMTYNVTPLWIDDYASLARGVVKESISVGPGQMHTKNLIRWGHEESKWELGWRLHTDVHFALDASSRLIHELIVKYRRAQIEGIREACDSFVEGVMKGLFGNRYVLRNPDSGSYAGHLSNYVLKTERLEREAWPDIALLYNGGDKYKRKFIENLEILRF